MGVHKENIRSLIIKVSDNTYNNKITIAATNCKSVNNRIDEMLLTMDNEEIDICMLAGTWINDQATSDKLEQMEHKFLPVKGCTDQGKE